MREMNLARFIASAILLWCLAQFPEILEEVIFPLSLINASSLFTSL